MMEIRTDVTIWEPHTSDVNSSVYLAPSCNLVFDGDSFLVVDLKVHRTKSLEVNTWMNTHPINKLRHAEQRTMRRRSSSSSETKGRGARPIRWATCRGLCLPQCGTSLSCYL